MANVDNPHGLRPIMRTISGGPVHVAQFSKLSSYGTALFINDVVARVASGDIQVSTTALNHSGVNLNYGAASTATDHLVIISVGAMFEAQDNNDSVGLVYADMGLNCEIEFNAGSATTGISGHELDESTAAVGNTLDVHLLQKLDTPDNAYGSFCRVEVIFNTHRMGHGNAGI